MIVADASVGVLALLNDGPARALVSQEAIAVPHLIDVEVVHALRRRVLHDQLEAGYASNALRSWAQLGLRRFATVGLLDRIWALRENLTAYDASYVALAESLDCPLATADARLANAPGPTCTITIVRR